MSKKRVLCDQSKFLKRGALGAGTHSSPSTIRLESLESRAIRIDKRWYFRLDDIAEKVEKKPK